MPPKQLSLVDEDQVGDTPDSAARGAFDLWNEHAKKFGWPVAQHNTAGRPAKLRRTVKDVGGLPQLRRLLEKCGTSDFLCGRSQGRERKPFKFTLDWFVKPANLLKCMEGNYFSDDVQAQSMKPVPVESETEKWSRWLRTYRPGRFWPTSSQGPRPEDPGCIAAPGPLAYWRKKHNITVAAAPRAESREDRLRATITTFRKFGRYDRANEIEQELADIEGRPAVLVPAPEVAHLTGSESQSPSPRLPMSQKSPADEERARREAFEKKRQSGTASDLPGWVDEAIPDSAYGDA